MDIREKIISFIRTRGPILPVQLAKEINTNVLMASAHLAELSEDKKVKVSNLKIGSSPLYYLQGQEIRLQSFANNLVEKEKMAFDTLRESKILRDSELEPSLRVAIKSIKDFAIPLQVDYHNKSEVFWKWYLLDDKEVELLIKEKIMPQEKIKQENLIHAKEVEIEKRSKELGQLKENINEGKIEERQKTLENNNIDKKRSQKLKSKDELLEKRIEKVLMKKEIVVVQENVDQQKDYIVKVRSSVGPLFYYCRVIDRKKIGEGDLSSLYIDAQSKKMPAMLVTSGQLTKKAKWLIENDLKGIVIVDM